MMQKANQFMNENVMKGINVFLTCLLVGQIICRVFLAEDPTARGFIFQWAFYILIVAVLNCMAEFRKPDYLLPMFPLLLVRRGRGLTFILLALPMFAPQAITVILGILVMLGGALNILLGWNDVLTTTVAK